MCKEKIKVNITYKLPIDPSSPKKSKSPRKSKKSKSSLSKPHNLNITGNFSSELESSPEKIIPKRVKIQTFEEIYGDIIKRLPTAERKLRGPNITYTDGITPDTLDQLRKDCMHRLSIKKRKEQEKIQKLKARNKNYNQNLRSSIPDFESQIPKTFHVKYQREDDLGVRNLVVDKGQLIRATRPDMDKLVLPKGMRHEVKDETDDEMSMRGDPGADRRYSKTSVEKYDDFISQGDEKYKDMFSTEEKGNKIPVKPLKPVKPIKPGMR